MCTRVGLAMLVTGASLLAPFGAFAWIGSNSNARAGAGAPRPPTFTLAPSTPSPTAARAALVVIARGRQVSLARVSPTDASVTNLTFRPPSGLESNRGFGSTILLSPDGTHLAFVRDRRAVVRVVAGAGLDLEAAVFSRPIGDAVVSYVGWSPDGSRLALRLAAPATGDGPEPRLPVPVGVYVWSGPGSNPVRLSRAPDDVAYWTADGASLLAHAYVAQSHYELRRVPADDSPPAVLSTVRLPYGYAQLHPAGDTMVYVRSEQGPTPGSTSNSYVAMQSLDGTNLRRLSPDTDFATDQRPEFSPDRARYAYTHQPRNAPMEIMVGEVATAAPRSAYRCAQSCWFAWESPDRMLVTDGGRLVRVPVQGPPVVLVPAGVQVVAVAGDG